MRGDLSETSVADLCRGLSAAEGTGALEVEAPAGEARIFFREGNVYWAASPTPRARLGDRLVNSGLLTQEQLDGTLEEQRTSSERTKLGALLVDRGLVSRDAIRVFVLEQILDALFEMMRWHQGAYVFNPGEVVDEKLPVDVPVDQLLVEVARRESEWDQIQAVIPDLDMVPDFVRGGSTANAALEPDEFTVLANVDGARTIRELADDLGYSAFEAARIVYGLTLLGIVDVRGDDVEQDVEQDVAAETDVADDVDGGDLGVAVDVDVASALEEALAGATATRDEATDEVQDPAPARPRVRLHVDDDVSDYVPSRDAVPATTEDVGDTAEDVAAPGAEEPEPWVAEEEVPPPGPTTDVGFFAGTTAPPSARSDELGDEEFDALLSELATPPQETATPAPPGASPEAAEAAEAADEVVTAPDDVEGEGEAEDGTVPPAEEAPPETRRPPPGGDVSEFLRELSQLAVDEPPANANPGPTTPRPAPAEPEDASDAGSSAPPPPRPAPASRDEDRRQAAEKRDERNKKRGLFGWGR